MVQAGTLPGDQHHIWRRADAKRMGSCSGSAAKGWQGPILLPLLSQGFVIGGALAWEECRRYCFHPGQCPAHVHFTMRLVPGRGEGSYVVHIVLDGRGANVSKAPEGTARTEAWWVNYSLSNNCRYKTWKRRGAYAPLSTARLRAFPTPLDLLSDRRD